MTEAAPQLLRAVGDALSVTPTHAPDDRTVEAMARLLREGIGGPSPALPLSAAGFDPGRLEWLRLTEAAAGPDVLASAARAAAAWTALATEYQEVVLTVGADADGIAGVAVGLPPRMRGQWLSDHAPDLLWEPGSPAGGRLVGRGAPEAVLHPRPAARPPNAAGADGGAIRGLSRLLSLPLTDWCVVLRLTPVGRAEVVAAQRGVVGIEHQTSRKLSVSTTAYNESAVNEDPQVRVMLDTLGAWQELLRTCLAEGAWRCTVHAVGGTPATLGVVVAAVHSLLGVSAAATQDRPVQGWDEQPASGAAQHRGFHGWLSSADLGALLVPPAEALGAVQVRRPLPGGRRQTALPRPLWLGEWLGTGMAAGVDSSPASPVRARARRPDSCSSSCGTATGCRSSSSTPPRPTTSRWRRTWTAGCASSPARNSP
jgi:hypothetical protein